jgi:hypothetical protein
MTFLVGSLLVAVFVLFCKCWALETRIQNLESK